MISKVLYMSDIRSLKSSEVLEALEGDPRLVRLPRSAFKGVPWSKLAAVHGLVKSRSEATRIIKPRNSGLSMNELAVTDPRQELATSNLIDGHLAVLRRGSREMVVFYVDR